MDKASVYSIIENKYKVEKKKGRLLNEDEEASIDLFGQTSPKLKTI